MKIFIFFLLSLTSLCCFGQSESVKGKLITSDTADLTILKIYPDSFPNVSVVFKAETRSGEPIWNLTKEKMQVKENAEPCEVILLNQVSKFKPINLGIVIDHSGSMQADFSLLFTKDGIPLIEYDDEFNPIFPENYSAPIDNAKKAVKKFVESFNTEKDFISITGFSSTIDRRLPLTQNVEKIKAAVDSMNADFSTALYDGMLAGLSEINKSEGIRVLVVLTDGNDNASKSKWNDVIDQANMSDIPIYIIGLGDVSKDTLALIAKQTKGNFYFTPSSSSLDTVYAAISRQVQAFYNLVYTSSNFSSADSIRQIELSFDIDSVFLFTEATKLNLPKEVLTFIEQKEKEKEYKIYGGVAIIVLTITGSLIYNYRKRRKNNPSTKRIFPNPSSGNIWIDFSGPSGLLQILAINGNIVKSFDISEGVTEFDLSELADGLYIAVVHSDGQKSNSMKFMIKH